MFGVPENLEDAIAYADLLQKALCCYMGDRCDCKYLDPEKPKRGHAGGELTGCCEARALGHYLRSLRAPELHGGKWLRQLRDTKKITLRQVEGFAGVNNALMSQYEHDKIKEPSARVLLKLANFYEIPIQEFLDHYFGTTVK